MICALPVVVLESEGRCMKNLPSWIALKSRGVGAARARHISDIDNRLRISEWKTCKESILQGGLSIKYKIRPS
jgi:hypothetical protein